MKNIPPSLFVTLFFLMPLRLVALEDARADTQQESEAYREKQTQSNTRKARIEASKAQPQKSGWGGPTYGSITVIEEDDTSETSSPLYPQAAAETQPQQETSQRELTVEDFRNLAKQNPMLNCCVFKNGCLLIKDESLASEEERARTWHVFFATIKKEYGKEGETIIHEIQSRFVIGLSEGWIFYPALSAKTIEAALKELDHLSVTYPNSPEEIRSSRVQGDPLARADNLEEISNWLSSCKINHDGHEYYATLSTPTDIASTINATLCRTLNERLENRVTLHRISEELSEQELYPSIKKSFNKRFHTRFILGQPITAGAFREWRNSPSIYSSFLEGTVIDAWRGFRRLRQTFTYTRSGYSRIPDALDSNPVTESSRSTTENQSYQGADL